MADTVSALPFISEFQVMASRMGLKLNGWPDIASYTWCSLSLPCIDSFSLGSPVFIPPHNQLHLKVSVRPKKVSDFCSSITFYG